MAKSTTGSKRWIAAVAWLVVTACSRSTPTPAAAPAPKPARPAPTPAETGPASDPAKLITTPCVLHAGGGDRSGTNGVMTKATCWYNAECITTPGQASPGDGFVAVKCDQKACGCEWAMAHENHPGGDDMTLSSTFTIDSLCVGDMAEKLLVNRCIERVGLRLYRRDPP